MIRRACLLPIACDALVALLFALPIPACAAELATSQIESESTLVSLDLKDADILDVMRYFSEVAGINVVVAPSVTGSVTIRLIDVDWEEALRAILRAHDLGYDFDGTVLYIAPIAALNERVAALGALAGARAQSASLNTVVIRLNYAKADAVAAIVAGALSKRGSVQIDTRTNSLVVTDVADRLPRGRLIAFRMDH